MKGLKTMIIIEVQIILILLVYLVWKTIDMQEKVRRTNLYVHEAIRDTRFEEISQLNDLDILLGDPLASGTIIMYTKIDCEYCAGFFAETFPLIDSAYLKTGKLKLIIRYLPDLRDSISLEIIRYSYCMDQQGLFDDYLQHIGSGQDDFKGGLIVEAKNAKEMSSCIHSQGLNQYLISSATKARQAGINVTPFFIINGKELRGDRKFIKFKELIEQG